MTDNELIAEFMGWEKGRYGNLPNKLHKGEGIFEIGIYNSDLRYDASWDWLMPVVEKISNLDRPQIENYKSFDEFEEQKFTFLDQLESVTEIKIGNCNIEFISKAVVDFIKWYNENKKSE